MIWRPNLNVFYGNRFSAQVFGRWQNFGISVVFSISKNDRDFFGFELLSFVAIGILCSSKKDNAVSGLLTLLKCNRVRNVPNLTDLILLFSNNNKKACLTSALHKQM